MSKISITGALKADFTNDKSARLKLLTSLNLADFKEKYEI